MSKLFRRYTKAEIAYVYTNWRSISLEEMAKKLNRSTQSVQYIAGQINKAGFKLERKSGPKLVDLIKGALG